MRKKSKDAGPDTASSTAATQLLQGTRAHIGVDASEMQCCIAIAAAAKVSDGTARKALRGRPIGSAMARSIAAAVSEWGVKISAGDLALGAEVQP